MLYVLIKPFKQVKLFNYNHYHATFMQNSCEHPSRVKRYAADYANSHPPIPGQQDESEGPPPATSVDLPSSVTTPLWINKGFDRDQVLWDHKGIQSFYSLLNNNING